MALLRLQHVSQFYHRSGGAIIQAVSDVSLVVQAHQFVCLIGPSGCGKTTLLQLLAGLIPIVRGQIDVDRIPMFRPFTRTRFGFSAGQCVPLDASY